MIFIKRNFFFLVITILITVSFNGDLFSADKLLHKKLARDVNEYAIEKLGLSLEEISLLFYFKKETYFGPEVIDEYLENEQIKRLMMREYLVLKEANDLGADITGGDSFYYFTLTSKAKVLVQQK